MDSKELIIKVKEQYGLDVNYNQIRRWLYSGVLERPKLTSEGYGKGVKSVFPDSAVIEVATLYWLNIKLRVSSKTLLWVKQLLGDHTEKALSDPHIRVLMGQQVTEGINPERMRGLTRYLIVRTALEQGYKPSEPRAWSARFHFHVEKKHEQPVHWTVRVELNPVPVNEPIVILG